MSWRPLNSDDLSGIPRAQPSETAKVLAAAHACMGQTDFGRPDVHCSTDLHFARGGTTAVINCWGIDR